VNPDDGSTGVPVNSINSGQKIIQRLDTLIEVLNQIKEDIIYYAK
jgi:hypothetical protein